MIKTSAKTVDDAKNEAVNLYWLAFLLTGRCDLAVDLASDAVASDDYSNAFFMDWMHAWSRRLVIGKAVAAIRGELADSARRIKLARVAPKVRASTGPLPNGDVTKAEIEQALLAVDVFPRAVVLLLVFEGVRMADATTLLDVDAPLIKKAQAIGLRDYTANLARIKGVTVPVPTHSGGETGKPIEHPKTLCSSLAAAMTAFA
jgi:DNA-directed RNA polymerase specialized sigma24 family protein